MSSTASHSIYQNIELQRTNGIPEDMPPSYSEAMASAHSWKVPVQQSLKSISENPNNAIHISVIETPPSLLTIVTPSPMQVNSDHSYDNVNFSNDPSETITNQSSISTNDLDAKRYADERVNSLEQNNTNSNNNNDDCCKNPQDLFLGCLCCIDFCRCLLICFECAMISQC
ncbi:uncharacterized protein LOC131668472 [Phymastichus coffea]|uniref:uncharacterized protein LOC131668472 n=1 Tax=Phymastichus coffea TaxID=108790 RepID=UPI00273A90EC|nr:uncharacterized protein LOC131668472 [Phymastichus coffea]